MAFQAAYRSLKFYNLRYNNRSLSRPAYMHRPRTVSNNVFVNAQNPLIIKTLDSQQLDLSDFPALGTGGASATAGVGTGASGANSSGNHVNSSYAAQAQHHSSATQGPNQAMGNGITRDFTNPDDFPALGGQSVVHDGHLQSPGMNGYQNQQQHSLQSVSILRNNLMAPDDKRVRLFSGIDTVPSYTDGIFSKHTR
jgi:hypothetical protein